MRALRPLLLAALSGTCALPALAQNPAAEADTTARRLGRVVVTATRTAELLEDVAVPTTVVDARDAEADGRLRLTDLLADVPGLTITSDFGAGVQVQGLDPAYTLILIDGEPVVGRDAGVLDLKRLAISGLDRVEIVRGPSSSLYGSDALAGVINLVTRTPTETGGRLRARTGTFGTTAFTAEGETAGTWRGGPLGLRLTLDRFATEGYDLDPDVFGPTTPAVGESTADLRASVALGERTEFTLGGRTTAGTVNQSYGFTDVLGATSPIDQTERRVDWSVHPELTHRFGRIGGAALSGTATAYVTGYRLDTDIVNRTTGQNTFDDRFDQSLLKGEARLSALWSATQRTLVGAGAFRDAIGGNRYGGDAPRQHTLFGFVQHDWEPSRLVALNLSARVDAPSAVGARVTPKVAVLLRPTDRYRLRLSVGSGFRAPDPRQLYLSFTNPAGGYVVYGATRLEEALARLDAEGRLGAVYVDPAGLGAIRPESSVALNAEVEAEPVRGLRLTLGGFRNAITDLIDVQPVAQLVGGGPVYSYLNVARVRTEGATFDVAATPVAGLSIGAGLQLLRTRDLDVVDAIRAGTVFSRDETGREARVTLADYTNLVGRARATGTLRTAYTAGGWTASVRGRLRSRTALRDLDGNGVATRDDEFVPATAIWDATLGRDLRVGRLARAARVQLGIDNAFGTTQPDLQPTLAGRRVYASLDLSF
ncbi:MAG TPA: TonB-dependent receptor [Rubricoccaceae bacterium]|jgi:outer membrane receptor for ferrienterochelin and colicins